MLKLTRFLSFKKLWEPSFLKTAAQTFEAGDSFNIS